MKRKIAIIISVIVLISLLIFGYFYFIKFDIKFDKKDLEINSVKTIGDLIISAKNVTVINKTEQIDTTKLGQTKVIVHLKKRIGVEEYKIEVKIVDTEKPKIDCKKEIKIISGDKIDLLKDVKVTDNSKENIKAEVSGDYDAGKEGTYKLKYIAKDSSGNIETVGFTLIVNKKIVQNSNKKPYYIKINRKQNVVMVYGLENNEYTKLVKTFICSTGTYTPLGTYNTTDKYIWRPLVNNVYGQYATRITGSILFHSVPYFKQTKNSLEYEEYNKLGTKASLGCIRLTVEDSKWIYDNCPKGTTVTIYDSDNLNGIEKPTFKKIDVNSKNRGWDPTDPDPNNPW